MGIDATGQGTDWIQKALQQYEKPLARYAAQLLQGDIDSARDAVQDTFLRLCRERREEIEPRLAPWLYTVCRNRVVDMMRKDSRMAVMLDADVLADRASADPSPAHTAERNDNLSRINTVLRGLPENQREVVRLKFQNGLSYKEISDVTRLSVTNVGFLLHTALKTLRGQLKTELNLPDPVPDGTSILNRRTSL